MLDQINNYLSSSGWIFNEVTGEYSKDVSEPQQIMIVNGQKMKSNQKTHKIKIRYEGDSWIKTGEQLIDCTEWSFKIDDQELDWRIIQNFEEFQKIITQLC